MSTTPPTDLEVQFKPESQKAVVEGKTTVLFASLIGLIAKRKLQTLVKTSGKEPVILGSELLSAIASAPEDTPENRQNLILVSMLTGGLVAVALFSLLQVLLITLGSPFTFQELLTIAGSIVLVAVLTMLLMKIRKLPKGQKIQEAMEGLAGFFK